MKLTESGEFSRKVIFGRIGSLGHPPAEKSSRASLCTGGRESARVEPPDSPGLHRPQRWIQKGDPKKKTLSDETVGCPLFQCSPCWKDPRGGFLNRGLLIRHFCGNSSRGAQIRGPPLRNPPLGSSRLRGISYIHMYVCMYVCMYVRTYVRT